MWRHCTLSSQLAGSRLRKLLQQGAALQASARRQEEQRDEGAQIATGRREGTHPARGAACAACKKMQHSNPTLAPTAACMAVVLPTGIKAVSQQRQSQPSTQDGCAAAGLLTEHAASAAAARALCTLRAPCAAHLSLANSFGAAHLSMQCQ